MPVERSVRTPMVKRLPTVASLAGALVVAAVLGHAWWSRVLVYVVTFCCVHRHSQVCVPSATRASLAYRESSYEP